MLKRMVSISDVFRCIWCEKVWATKVELFQHFLIDHQDNLVASAEADSDRPSGSNKDPKLQKEIADLEKRVLGNYKVRHIAHLSFILKMCRGMLFPTMWHFDKCRLGRASAAYF